jgi:hypothetical protein
MSEMTEKELKIVAFMAVNYVSNTNKYFNSSFPGLNVLDPVLVMVRLMASKNPSSLIKALLLSDNKGM